MSELTQTPEWLVETITNASRLMSANPQTIADTVWWELHKRIELEVKESIQQQVDGTLRAMAEWRLKDRETVPGFIGCKIPEVSE